MKGVNELRLNKATMCAALQHYLDTVLLKDQSVEVTDIFEVSSAGVFVVHMSEKKPSPKGVPA